MIDEVRAEVVEDSTAGCGGFSPWRGPRFVAKTVEARFKEDHAAERVLTEELSNREEVALPPAVVKDGQDAISFAREVDQLSSTVRRDGEGLVDHDVFPGQKSATTEIEMRLVRRQAGLINVFNEHAVISGNTTVLTALNSSRFKTFNPFTDSPVECPQGASSATCRAMGANWQKGTKFGTATGPTNYQTPRTYRVSLGFKF